MSWYLGAVMVVSSEEATVPEGHCQQQLYHGQEHGRQLCTFTTCCLFAFMQTLLLSNILKKLQLLIKCVTSLSIDLNIQVVSSYRAMVYANFTFRGRPFWHIKKDFFTTRVGLSLHLGAVMVVSLGEATVPESHCHQQLYIMDRNMQGNYVPSPHVGYFHLCRCYC